jgi:hypothetical protein
LTKTCAKIVLVVLDVGAPTSVTSTPTGVAHIEKTPVLANNRKMAHADVKRGAGSDDLSSWAKRVDITGFSEKLLVTEEEFLRNGH